MRCNPGSVGGVCLAAVVAAALAGCAGADAPQPQLAVAEPPAPAVIQPAPPAEPRVKAAKPRKPSEKPSEKAAEVASPSRTFRPAGAEPAAAVDVDSRDEASCTSVDVCASVLKAMIADPARRWMHRPAPPAVLANGVRLFAYRALRERLACPELAMAAAQAEQAATAFRWGVAGVAAAQADRARALSLEVAGELETEHGRRCAPRSKVGAAAPAAPGGPLAR